MQRIRGVDHDGEPAPVYFPSTVPVPVIPSEDDPTRDAQVARQTRAWGTKWTPTAQTRVEINGSARDGEVEYIFDTAWSPPVPWVLTTSEQFPGLTFDVLWCEEDCSAGRFHVRAGALLEKESVHGTWAELNAWCENHGLEPQYPPAE